MKKTPLHHIEIFPSLSDGEDGRWRWGKETSAERIAELCARTVGVEKRYDVFQIDYAEGINGEKRIKPKTVWSGKGFANESGSLELKDLFGKKYFETPKPTGLIKYCLEHATQKNDLVLDFFAGSATTAHAVMQLNAEDGGNRKFIMVQLSERCDEQSRHLRQVTKPSQRSVRSVSALLGKRFWKANARMAGTRTLASAFSRSIHLIWPMFTTRRTPSTGVIGQDDRKYQTGP